MSRNFEDILGHTAQDLSGMTHSTPAPAFPDTTGQTQPGIGDYIKMVKGILVGEPEKLLSGETSQLKTPLGDITYPSGAPDAAMALPLLGNVMRGAKGAIKTGMPFFSQLAKTIMERAPEKAVAEHFLNVARKGSKAEELAFTGLEDYLRQKAGQKLSKADVLKYLEDNAPDLRERMIGGKLKADYSDYADPHAAGSLIEGVKPKFTQYTLPGGENHRELVVTMPSKTPTIKKGGPEMPGLENAYDRQYEQFVADGGEPDDFMSFDDWLYEEAPEAVPQRDTANYNVPAGHAYGDPELDVNRLMHMRFNDRTTAEGEKALHLEELQSDWHQTGRKEGYGQKPKTQEELKKLYQIAQNYEDELPDFDTWVHEQDGYKKESGVPDAPFKATWHELGMRRALDEAARGGYDRLTWTTGAQQADRYSLAKHLNSDGLSWSLNHNGSVQLHAIDKNGSGAINQAVKMDDLADHVGENVAKQIRDTVGKGTEIGQITGDDLTVGGEGMKGFYDQMLPRYADKLGKKYGAKAEKVKIRGEAKWSEMDRDPRYHVQQQRGGGVIVFDNATNERSGFETVSEAKKHIQKKYGAGEHEVWSLKITPEMRKELTENGQPLFSRVPPLPPVRATDDRRRDLPNGMRPSH